MITLTYFQEGKMANIKDIAKAAHVSAITVSRVINGCEKVKAETKRRVEKIITEMAYIPNMAAKNLVSKRTGIIDVYIPESIDLSNPFVMYFIAGISEVLSEQMYSFLIRRSLQKEHSCDGYIVTGLFTNEIDDFHVYAQMRNRPVVLFGHTNIAQVNCMDVDNVLGAAMAVHHLIQHNHTRIGLINVDEDKDYTLDRYIGFKKALEDAGIRRDENLIIKSANSVNGGTTATKSLLERGSFTALFCATDTIAIGAVNAITETGLRVPQDISIVGFDGLGHHLLIEPHITTIRQPIFDIGKSLARVIIDRINGDECWIDGFLPPELIPGKSVNRLI
jgi:LacI family transcriptional regulator